MMNCYFVLLQILMNAESLVHVLRNRSVLIGQVHIRAKRRSQVLKNSLNFYRNYSLQYIHSTGKV